MSITADANNEVSIKYFPMLELALGLALCFMFLSKFYELNIIISALIIILGVIFVGRGIYHLLLTDKIIVDKGDGIIRYKKFVGLNEENNKFANCIEYDYFVNRSLLDVLLGSSQLKFVIKIRRGINDYIQETLSYQIDREDEGKLIELLSAYFDYLKVEI